MTVAIIDEVERAGADAIAVERSNEEAALIRKIVGGQCDLFNDLIAPHLTPLSRTLRAMIRNPADVDDIVQQTVLKAFARLAQFRFEAAFRTWLIQIGLNEVRKWRRRNASSVFIALAPFTPSELRIVDQGNSPFIEYQRSETLAQLSAALAHLPEKYRNVILMRDFEDLSISEVAVRLGLSIGAVKSRHWRARQKVVGFLEQSRKFGRKVGFIDDAPKLPAAVTTVAPNSFWGEPMHRQRQEKARTPNDDRDRTRAHDRDGG